MFEIIPNWHPVFVHFTVALWSLAAFFYLSLPLIKSPSLHMQWTVLARCNLWLGTGFGVVTAILGWLAYNSVAHDTPSHVAMTEHRNWAVTTLLLFLLLTGWSVWRYRRNITATSVKFLTALALAAVLLMTTAWHGAEVVYRYGIGVKSLPKAEGKTSGDAHAHEHAGEEMDMEMDMDMDMSMEEEVIPPVESEGGHGHDASDPH